jgi:hypothetical protein
MDGANDIYLVYSLGSNNDLVVRRLTYNEGLWSVGSLNTIYDGDDNYYPSITVQPSGRVWVSWSRYASGQYNINAKYSDNGGESWGSGPSDPGYELAAEVSSGFSKLTMLGSYIYAVYSLDGTRAAYRRKHVNITLWEDEEIIAEGSGFDSDFDVAVSNDSRLGVVFDNGLLRFREFDGNGWGGILDVDENEGFCPQMTYFENVPYVLYSINFSSEQKKLLYSSKPWSVFTDPEILDSAKSVFGKVHCYNSIVANYSDVTTEAGDDTAGDIYHPDSSVMFKEPGDALYLGMNTRFHYLKVILSAAGSSGQVSWQYFNGTEWMGFDPHGGSFDFDSSDKTHLLWDDYTSIPDDWQKSTVLGDNLFWIRIVVVSPFTTGPVGTQITSISNAKAIVVME